MLLDPATIGDNAAAAIEAAYQMRLERIGELTGYMVTAGDPQDCFVWTASCLRVATGADGIHPLPDPFAVLNVPPVPAVIPAESQDRYRRIAVAWAAANQMGVQYVYNECLGYHGDSERVAELMSLVLLHARNAVIRSRAVFQ